MRILAFETSAKAASAAILEEDRLLGETCLNCGQTHSRTLMKMADDAMYEVKRGSKGNIIEYSDITEKPSEDEE